LFPATSSTYPFRSGSFPADFCSYLGVFVFHVFLNQLLGEHRSCLAGRLSPTRNSLRLQRRMRASTSAEHSLCGRFRRPAPPCLVFGLTLSHKFRPSTISIESVDTSDYPAGLLSSRIIKGIRVQLVFWFLGLAGVSDHRFKMVKTNFHNSVLLSDE